MGVEEGKQSIKVPLAFRIVESSDGQGLASLAEIAEQMGVLGVRVYYRNSQEEPTEVGDTQELFELIGDTKVLRPYTSETGDGSISVILMPALFPELYGESR